MANANNNANNENMVMAGRKRRNRVKAASSQDQPLEEDAWRRPDVRISSFLTD